MSIYNETGGNHGAVLDPYKQSAAIVEASDLDYTLIRPGWHTYPFGEYESHLP